MLRSFISILLGQGLSLVFNVIIFGIIARKLGVDEFGLFNYWLAVIAIIIRFLDFGLNPIIFREFSKKENYSEIYSVFIVRLVLFLVLILIMNIVFQIISITNLEKVIANIFIINVFFSHKYVLFRDLVYIPYKVKFRMQIPYFIVFLEQFALLILVIFFDLGFSEHLLINFAIMYFAVNVPGALFLYFLFLKKNNYFTQINIPQLKQNIYSALPIAGQVFLLFFFMQMDVFFIKHFLGDYEVGLYSAAIRLVSPMIIIGSAVTTTFFPKIVKNLKSGLPYYNLNEYAMKIFLTISIFLGLFITFYSDKVFNLIWGVKFIQGQFLFILLFWTLFFRFLNNYFLDFFTALDLQKNNFIYSALIVLFNAVLNIIFIPKFGLDGVGYSKLLSLGIGFMFCFLILKKEREIPKMNLIKFFLFSIIIGIIFYLLSSFNLFIGIIVASIILIPVLLLLQIFTKNDILQIYQMVIKNG